MSTFATLASLYFIFMLARTWYDERAALASIVTLAFFPTAFYLNAVYSDALFLALSSGCPLALNDPRGLPLISYPRYALVVFPLFLAVGVVLARSRVALVAWTVGSAAVGAYLTVLYTSWRWVA